MGFHDMRAKHCAVLIVDDALDAVAAFPEYEITTIGKGGV